MALDNAQKCETTDVLICGGGPTGSLLSASLGQMSVRNIVLERDEKLEQYPRAFSMGEDAIRSLQSVGLYDQIYTRIGASFTHGIFVGGRHHDLHHTPFLRLDRGAYNGYTGHTQAILFKQPVMERCLRDVISSNPVSELRVGCTVTSIDQDEDWVYVAYSDANGKDHRIRSRFMVGADGKRGFTRKRYLESKGVIMERTHSYEETYMRINWHVRPPTPSTHPDFPLWKLGYTPTSVYDSFIPEPFIFISTPDRPGCSARIGYPTDDPKLWRIEYQVFEGENVAEMSTPERIKDIVMPYLTHRGERYGLKHDVVFPEDCLTLVQSGPYLFAAKTCNKWFHGRVMLVGDAAHVFPPFGGQGLQCGLLDATGLSWRLKLALHTPRSKDYYTTLLQSWTLERKCHVQAALAITVRNGDLLTVSNPVKLFVRDWALWLVRLVPQVRRMLEEQPSQTLRYEFEEGMASVKDACGGVCLGQAYCVRLGHGGKAGDGDTMVVDGDGDGKVMFTDDVIFAGVKQGLFQIVVLLDSVSEIPSAREVLKDVDSVSEGFLRAAEATYITHDPLAKASPSSETGTEEEPSYVVRLATAAEFTKSTLCKGRSAPSRYDANRMRNDVNGSKFVIVRPDRFVFAACREEAGLMRAVGMIKDVVGDGVGG